MKAKPNQKGFTLIELLVVITIIAILASVSMPVFSSIQRKAKLNKSLQQAKGIYTGMYSLYGADGFLPEEDNSNDILKDVAIDMDSEKPFYVAGSMWHGRGNTSGGGDDLHERSTPAGIALESGENHYAVNKTSTFEPRYPILASGFSQTPGKYAQEKTERGGIWGGTDAVCIFGDGSGDVVKLNEQYRAMKDIKGSQIDLFKYQGKVNMVNPKRGN